MRPTIVLAAAFGISGCFAPSTSRDSGEAGTLGDASSTGGAGASFGGIESGSDGSGGATAGPGDGTVGAGSSGGDGSDSGGTPVGGDGPAYYGNVVGVTQEVADHLRAVAAIGDHDPGVFLKSGDSITAGTGPQGAFGCFAAAEGATIDLGDHPEWSTTVAHFDQVPLGDGQTSWDRDSSAAMGGVGAQWITDGDPSPLQQEIDAIDPRFAVVMIGTNDAAGSVPEYGFGPYGVRDYTRNMLAIVDTLEAQGVVPILTYIPPVNSDPVRSYFAVDLVAVLRAIATARRIPTIDFYSPMDALGLPENPDGVHPSWYPAGSCILDAVGLQYGYNIRNAASLAVMDKVRRVVLDGVSAIDPDPPGLVGEGTREQPFAIPELPFALAVDLADAPGPDALADYGGCGGLDGAGGPETVFSLEVSDSTPVRAMVTTSAFACESETAFTDCNLTRDTVIALFADGLTADHCVIAHSTVIQARLLPGVTYHVVVDSFGTASADTDAFVSVHRCHVGDPACEGP